jgi:hypothetical protein
VSTGTVTVGVGTATVIVAVGSAGGVVAVGDGTAGTEVEVAATAGVGSSSRSGPLQAASTMPGIITSITTGQSKRAIVALSIRYAIERGWPTCSNPDAGWLVTVPSRTGMLI